jgi:hypothetical protein
MNSFLKSCKIESKLVVHEQMILNFKRQKNKYKVSACFIVNI